TVTVMNEIRDMGVRFAVDDFGIGFSSLRYLDQLPVDVLKIDKAFIDPITDRYEGAQIATAVIALARSFEMISVAEGVETAEQLEALRMRGCDEIQGYLVSKPLDARAFRAFAFPAGGAGRPDPDPSA
ncbi:MAG TPA: EAL domain-containing protein, partial [Spirochaetia bacterium]|nr:EAL domain-containing protein [Spirochaetia bacterium]